MYTSARHLMLDTCHHLIQPLSHGSLNFRVQLFNFIPIKQAQLLHCFIVQIQSNISFVKQKIKTLSRYFLLLLFIFLFILPVLFRFLFSICRKRIVKFPVIRFLYLWYLGNPNLNNHQSNYGSVGFIRKF